jgi:hypothetical protein
MRVKPIIRPISPSTASGIRVVACSRSVLGCCRAARWRQRDVATGRDRCSGDLDGACRSLVAERAHGRGCQCPHYCRGSCRAEVEWRRLLVPIDQERRAGCHWSRRESSDFMSGVTPPGVRLRMFVRSCDHIDSTSQRSFGRGWLRGWEGRYLGSSTSTIRELVYKDRVGDMTAHYLSTLILIVLLGLYFWWLGVLWVCPLRGACRSSRLAPRPGGHKFRNVHPFA